MSLPRKINIKGLGQWQEQFSRGLGDRLIIADILGRKQVRDEILADAKVKVTRQAQIDFAEVIPEGVKPQDAIDFLRGFVPMSEAAYQRLSARYRLGAFYVARVESVDLIARAQQLLLDALDQGTTAEEFIRQLNAAFDAAGVTRLNPFHIETVYQTNMANAYQLGRFFQMRDPDVLRALPWWQYHTVGDNHVRPAHRAMDKFIARADDTIWNRWYPPNGFNCRCTVTAVGNQQAADLARGTNQNISLPGSGRIPLVDGKPAVPDAGFANGPGKYFEDLLKNRRP